MKLSDLPIEDSPYKLDEHGPIFILGCPRSGTTFLSSCVGAIPGTREFVGVLAPPRIMHLIETLSDEYIKKELMYSIKDIFWQTYWRDAYFKHSRLIRLLRRQISFSEFRQPPSLKNTFFCYKEPFLCFAAPHFAEAFPNAKFIHIIRDGRDNADSMDRKYHHALSNEVLSSHELSMNKVSEIGQWETVDGFNYPYWVELEDRALFRNSSRYARYLMMWKFMVEKGQQLKKLGKDRYFEIRYEDFVQSPINYGNQIRTFIGAQDSKIFQNKLKKAFRSSINIATQNQEQHKIDEANLIAKDLLIKLGYSV